MYINLYYFTPRAVMINTVYLNIKHLNYFLFRNGLASQLLNKSNLKKGTFNKATLIFTYNRV